MNFTCKFCKEEIKEYVQCKKCLNIFCKSCSLHCNDCGVDACKPCQRDMCCGKCQEIICMSCPYIEYKSLNHNNGKYKYTKYCIKNGCYQEKIGKQTDQTRRFVEYIERLNSQMFYMPNGEAYLEAKEDFESHAENT